MSYKAIDSNGRLIMAADVPITDQGKHFKCPTPGCPAEMTIVLAGNRERASFRRFPSSPEHISNECVRWSIHFCKKDYDERSFSPDKIFNAIFKPANPTVNSQRFSRKNQKQNTQGEKTKQLTKLGDIYKMCDSLGVDEYYNGFRIGDFFANEKNYSNYKGCLEGNKIVECSFAFRVRGKNALAFNYPCNYKNEHDLIKVTFSSKEMCNAYLRKYEKSDHTEPIAIAGDWHRLYESDIFCSECQFMSDRQIYLVVK